MARLEDATVEVERLGDDPAHRRLRVRYRLVLDPGERLVGHDFVERVTVHAVDEHDAAVPPDPRPFVEGHERFTGEAGSTDRTREFVVDAAVLDVQPDWVARTADGSVRPIAAWADHLAADITLSTSGRVVATVTTPTITGSWGSLGDG